MNRRSFLFFLVWLALLLASLSIPSCTNARPPHIFIIIVDAARYDLLNGNQGDQPLLKSFHEFASVSNHYSYCISNAPYTGPSVASILTGLYPETHTVRGPGSQTTDKIPFIQEKLAEHGYDTTLITGNAVLLRHRLMRGFKKLVFIRPFGKNISFADSSYQDIEMATDALAKLDYSRPQFVYIHLLPPHEPYRPPQPWSTDLKEVEGESAKIAAYRQNAGYADCLVGELLNQIRKIGRFDDAMVIVGSDHGEAFGEHGFQGHITTVYEEMIRVPLFVKFPGQTTSVTFDMPCSLVDITPTILDLLKIEPDCALQGEALPMNGVQGERPKRVLYSRAVGKQVNGAVVDFPLKYIQNNGKDELYALDADPSENHNLASARPNSVLRLKTALRDQLRRNLDLRTRLRIVPYEKRADLPELVKELETLGYL